MSLSVQLLVFLPLVAALTVGLNTRRLTMREAQWVTALPMVISALLSAFVFYGVVIKKAIISVTLLSWISVGTFEVNWALYVDSLTAVMLVVVTWVSALVHIYSVGYMSHDPHPQRFMAYLSLFTFFMLMLVTSDNFLQLFLGWEGVGLCSYLLIGFWHHKPSANAAALKAFVVNRVGDFGFALGILAIFLLFGTIDFTDVFRKASVMENHALEFLGYQIHAMTLICLLLFVGAMGKSAQLGLHTWLPDAMEGPTPVSALIHAATMVTAGVFMVARCSPLFELSPVALSVVTVVGAVTCIFAATVAITQNDIKRVIAYSTCSQLGYMFFACGVSAYAAGVFHLMTHGFFKALLFLGAGSVIHALSDEQDMRKMGGVYNKIPLTYGLMLIGTLAITGFPLLSGYWSKDAIIEAAWAAGHHGNGFGELAYWLGVSAALLTAFYSWRLIFLTFHGECRASAKVQKHVHESPKIMTVPLIILAIGAVFAGGYAAQGLGIVHHNLDFWNGSISMRHGEFNVLEAAHHVPGWVKYSPLMVGVAGFILAYLLYIMMPKTPQLIASAFRPVYLFLLNKWYFDELYDAVLIAPCKRLGVFLWQKLDAGFIDRWGPNGLARLAFKLGDRFSEFQTGYVYQYAFVMIIGLLSGISWIIYTMMGF